MERVKALTRELVVISLCLHALDGDTVPGRQRYKFSLPLSSKKKPYSSMKIEQYILAWETGLIHHAALHVLERFRTGLTSLLFVCVALCPPSAMARASLIYFTLSVVEPHELLQKYHRAKKNNLGEQIRLAFRRFRRRPTSISCERAWAWVRSWAWLLSQWLITLTSGIGYTAVDQEKRTSIHWAEWCATLSILELGTL